RPGGWMQQTLNSASKMARFVFVYPGMARCETRPSTALNSEGRFYKGPIFAAVRRCAFGSGNATTAELSSTLTSMRPKGKSRSRITRSMGRSEPVLLHAAGSLRTALTEVTKAFEAASGQNVQAKYGPSGTLKNEIAGGAHAEVFASANMEHPQALATAGK